MVEIPFRLKARKFLETITKYHYEKILIIESVVLVIAIYISIVWFTGRNDLLTILFSISAFLLANELAGMLKDILSAVKKQWGIKDGKIQRII